MQKWTYNKYKPFILSLLYFVCGGLWIIISDIVANWISSSQYVLAQISILKGWFYIVVTAPIIYILSAKHMKAFRSTLEAEQKLRKSNEELKYYAEHDILTGLNNRWYYERKINEEYSKADMVGVILCDIDGLKLINDTLGQEAGDRYLIAFSKILKSVCPPNGTAARIGGDEFALIIHGISEEQTYKLRTVIKNAIDDLNRSKEPLLLSVSLGSSHRQSPNQKPITVLINEAEEQMNFQKLMQGQSYRSKTVDILMKTLEARDYITEGHSDRLQKMMLELCEVSGIGDTGKGRLALLARFHDIGKVGIPDAILFKPGKLTYEEYEEMKKHSEIGYRIANASPDLAYISDLVLKHHEWWNGQGYPLGLVGEEIPVECRILAIADAYDSMSNDRPYRKAMRYEERIKELKAFSGKQFDPNLIPFFIQIIEKSEGKTYN